MLRSHIENRYDLRDQAFKLRTCQLGAVEPPAELAVVDPSRQGMVEAFWAVDRRAREHAQASEEPFEAPPPSLLIHFSSHLLHNQGLASEVEQPVGQYIPFLNQ